MQQAASRQGGSTETCPPLYQQCLNRGATHLHIDISWRLQLLSYDNTVRGAAGKTQYHLRKRIVTLTDERFRLEWLWSVVTRQQFSGDKFGKVSAPPQTQASTKYQVPHWFTSLWFTFYSQCGSPTPFVFFFCLAVIRFGAQCNFLREDTTWWTIGNTTPAPSSRPLDPGKLPPVLEPWKSHASINYLHVLLFLAFTTINASTCTSMVLFQQSCF